MSNAPPNLAQRSTVSQASSVRPVAVIDVGTTSIRMAIAEIDDNDSVRILETLSQAVNLGKDSFTTGAIEKNTIEDCVRVLKSYRQLLSEYQITQPNQIRLVATSAVREAENKLAFLDRIYIATGLQIEPIDEAEVNRINYLGILPFLKSDPELQQAETLVIEVGGGSTEVLFIQSGQVMYSQTYRLGSLRLRETLEAYRAPTAHLRNIMQSQIDRTVNQIVQHVPTEGTIELIALGGDVRFAASQLLPDRVDGIGRLPVDVLSDFTNRMLDLSPDELVQKYRLAFPDAETLGPALLVYLRLARASQLDHILITDTNLRDGLLNDMAVHGTTSEEFDNQIIRSAIDLGRKFDFDEPHAKHVADLSRILFRELKSEHQLEPRYEVILVAAALLHEIGMFVSSRSFHKHTMYLIVNSELFGLSEKDVLSVSLVSRYHRRASPKPTHQGYATLNREDRIAVTKMAALLRVADALDHSHSQRVHEMTCEIEENRLVIAIPDVEDLSLEQLALRQKGSLFEEIFGLSILLRTARTL